MPLIVKNVEVEWVTFYEDKIVAHLSGTRKWEKITATLEVVNPELQNKVNKIISTLTKSKSTNGYRYLVSERQAVNGNCLIWRDVLTGFEITYHEVCFSKKLIEVIDDVKNILVEELLKIQ